MRIENKKDPVKIVKNWIFFFKARAFSLLSLFKTKAFWLLSNFKIKAFWLLSHFSQYMHFFAKRKQTYLLLTVTAALILNVFLLNTIAGQLMYSTSLKSHGTVQTIGVVAYKESSCVTLMSDVDWGNVMPGGYITKTVYIRNEGNSALTLSLNTENWSPTSADNYMALGWNYAGQTIEPNQVVRITLTLSVSQNINGIETFYFDIIIIGAS